jgi:DNA primase
VRTLEEAFRRYDAEAIKRANPLVDVLARYGVALRRSGRSLVGLCPFHPDWHKPNLCVYPDPDPARDDWFCFRCWSGGDALTFVMRLEGLGFAAACERLGGTPAAPAPDRPARLPEPPRRWDRLSLQEQVVMNTAAAVYRHRLWREPRALAYLRGRGIPDWVTGVTGLGYADGHTLERFLRRRSLVRVAEDLGLLRRSGPDDGARPPRDLLAGRIVIPEIRSGHAVWMIGRRVPDAGYPAGGVARSGGDPSDPPKYLSLPGERPVLGLERVAGRREGFLVEGVFGYLLALAWRLPACSGCGAHLSPDRLGFLARTRTLWGLLDPDDAGRAAAARLAEELGRRFRPLWLPGDLELDDLALRPSGRSDFFRVLAAARREPRSQDLPKELFNAR